MADQSDRSVKPGGDISPEERAEFKRRLSELDDRLDEAQERGTGVKNEAGRGKAMGYGLRIATDIIAAVVVGGGIGWFLDRWLDSGPLLLMVFIVLGIVAGIRNVIRTYRLMAAEFGTNTGMDLDDISTPERNGDDPN